MEEMGKRSTKKYNKNEVKKRAEELDRIYAQKQGWDPKDVSTDKKWIGVDNIYYKNKERKIIVKIVEVKGRGPIAGPHLLYGARNVKGYKLYSADLYELHMISGINFPPPRLTIYSKEEVEKRGYEETHMVIKTNKKDYDEGIILNS